jgi:hypothetical protein
LYLSHNPHICEASQTREPIADAFQIPRIAVFTACSKTAKENKEAMPYAVGALGISLRPEFRAARKADTQGVALLEKVSWYLVGYGLHRCRGNVVCHAILVFLGPVFWRDERNDVFSG